MPVNRRNGALRLATQRVFKTATAWAISISLIAIAIRVEQQVAAANERPTKHTPEFGVVGPAKAILIGSPPLNPEAHFAIADIREGFVEIIGENPSHTMKFIIAADYGDVVISGRGVPMLAFERICPAEGFAHHAHLEGWGLPGISQGNRHSKAAGYLLNSGPAGNEISAQLASGSFLSPLDQGVSGSPEFPSRYSEDDSEQRNDALSIKPGVSLAPGERRPFLPVFGLGAVTFLAGMFAGNYIYDRGSRAVGWYRYLLRCTAVLIVGLGSFSFAFGFPWAAIF